MPQARAIRLTLFFFCLLLSPPRLAFSDDPTNARNDFQRGVTAFQAEDYLAASRHFRNAREAGLDSAALYYNLGVSAYRQGNYQEAEQAFRTLAGYSGWRALAYYNLGLTSERQEQNEQARRYYQRTIDNADERKLERLASNALIRLSPEPVQVVSLLSLSGGYDSNPRLVETDFFSEEAELFIEGFASISIPISDSALRFDIEAYLRHYPGDNDLDDRIIQLGVSRPGTLAGFQTNSDLSLGFFSIGGERYQTRHRGHTMGERRLAGGNLSLGTEVSYFRAAPGYEFLEGTQLRLHSGWRQSLGSYQYRLGYRLELNDRDDQDSAGNTVSVSPTRHRLRAFVGRELGAGQWGEVGLGYENSRYTQEEASNGEMLKRQDHANQFLLRTGRSLGETTILIAEYSYTANQSNIDRFDTDQHLVQVLIEYRDF